jgi:hypothetical protein
MAKFGNNNAAGPHKKNGRRLGTAASMLAGPIGSYIAGNIAGKRGSESSRRVVSSSTATGMVGGALVGSIRGAIVGSAMGPGGTAVGAAAGAVGGAAVSGLTHYAGAKLGVRMTRPSGPPHSGVGMGLDKSRPGLHGK